MNLAPLAAIPAAKILAVALAVAAVFAVIQRFEIRALTAELHAIESQRDNIGKMLNEQNVAVAELKKASSQQQLAYEHAARQSEQILAESNARAAALLRANIPKNCDGAMKWLGKNIGKGLK